MEAMDFMDPRRRLQHNIRLIIGYVLVGIALLLTTIILLFVAYGFGLKNGQVIQSGLIFLSSTPNPAQIYIDGARYSNATNTKVVLPAGTYQVQLQRSGYRNWGRSMTVDGGTVQSFVYPFLFPATLTTNTVRQYAAAPSVVTESRDRHWLLVARPGLLTSFDLYDLNNPKQAPTVAVIPAAVVTPGAAQTIAPVAWSNDNTHLLLKHTYDTSTEYLIFNRANPDQSINLTKAFNLPLANIDLRLVNDTADHFIIWNTATHDVSRAVLGTPAVTPYVGGVLAFDTYGDNTVLYATPDPTDAGKVAIDLYDGANTYLLRHDKSGLGYLVATANYSGDMYVAVGATGENFAYVYKNPISELTSAQLGAALPAQVLGIKSPTSVSFSLNGQYVAFESADRLATYDVDNDSSYSYALPDTLDAPQVQARWMDSARLLYASHGQVTVFDYDGQNRQVLVSSDARYPVSFDQSYKIMYVLEPVVTDKNQELLTSTSLRTPTDQ